MRPKKTRDALICSSRRNHHTFKDQLFPKMETGSVRKLE